MSKYPYLTILQAAAPLPCCWRVLRCVVEGGKRAVRVLQPQAEAEAAGCLACGSRRLSQGRRLHTGAGAPATRKLARVG